MECLGYRTSNVSCASILFVVSPKRFIIILMKIKRTLAILSTRAKRKTRKDESTGNAYAADGLGNTRASNYTE